MFFFPAGLAIFCRAIRPRGPRLGWACAFGLGVTSATAKLGRPFEFFFDRGLLSKRRPLGGTGTVICHLSKPCFCGLAPWDSFCSGKRSASRRETNAGRPGLGERTIRREFRRLLDLLRLRRIPLRMPCQAGPALSRLGFFFFFLFLRLQRRAARKYLQPVLVAHLA